MFKSIGIVSLEILNYILFFIFLALTLVLVSFFPEDYVFPLAFFGVILSFYLSNIVTRALEKRFKLH
ncbi:hypothetical protein GM30_10125 [Trabulsiella odontotermitis]|nr:hypothetical protein GM30_10125 [Trabulsiella odontotermitis]